MLKSFGLLACAQLLIYKLITKVLVNRLRPLLNGIVSPSQASFIPGRQETDNIFFSSRITSHNPKE